MTKAKEYRLRHGLKAREVCQIIRVTPGCLSHYETGRRKIPVPIAKALAILYGCEWYELYGDDDG